MTRLVFCLITLLFSFNVYSNTLPKFSSELCYILNQELEGTIGKIKDLHRRKEALRDRFKASLSKGGGNYSVEQFDKEFAEEFGDDYKLFMKLSAIYVSIEKNSCPQVSQ